MLFAAAVALSAMALRAQDAPAKDMPQGMSGGCESFKWPLDKERTAFDDSGLEKLGIGHGARAVEGAGVRVGAWCRRETSPTP